MRYLIASDKHIKSCNYVTRSFFENILTINNIEFTFKKNEYSDEILLGGSEDYFSTFSRSIPNKKTYLLALSDPFDLKQSKKRDEYFDLSPLAREIYPKATYLLTFFEEQKEILEKKYNFKNVKTIPLLPSLYGTNLACKKTKLLSSEKSAFRKFFRISSKEKVIVSYGNYSNKEESKRFEALARMNPEYVFIFFGINSRDIVQSRMLERMVYPENIQFYDYIDEELYLSLLNSADLLIFTGDIIPYPNVILDFMINKIPIISSNSFLYSDMLNENNIIMPKDFESFYKAINSSELNHIKNNAYKYALNKYQEALKKEKVEKLFND